MKPFKPLPFNHDSEDLIEACGIRDLKKCYNTPADSPEALRILAIGIADVLEISLTNLSASFSPLEKILLATTVGSVKPAFHQRWLKKPCSRSN